MSGAVVLAPAKPMELPVLAGQTLQSILARAERAMAEAVANHGEAWRITALRELRSFLPVQLGDEVWRKTVWRASHEIRGFAGLVQRQAADAAAGALCRWLDQGGMDDRIGTVLLEALLLDLSGPGRGQGLLLQELHKLPGWPWRASAPKPAAALNWPNPAPG